MRITTTMRNKLKREREKQAIILLYRGFFCLLLFDVKIIKEVVHILMQLYLSYPSHPHTSTL